MIGYANSPRLFGRAVAGQRVEIGDNVALDSVVDGVSLFRKTI